MYTIVFIDFFFLEVIYFVWKILFVRNVMSLLTRLAILAPVAATNFYSMNDRQRIFRHRYTRMYCDCHGILHSSSERAGNRELEGA